MMTLSPEIIDELKRRNAEWFGEVDGGVLVTKINRGSPSERFDILEKNMHYAIKLLYVLKI